MSELVERINLEMLAKAIDEAKKNSKKRNFLQSVELIMSIAGLDLRRPENRIRMTVRLPHPSRKEKRIAVFTSTIDKEKIIEAGADKVFNERDIDEIGGSKKEIKKIAREYDFFISEPKLLAKIGKLMGSILGPRGKMPQILQPNIDISTLIRDLKSSVLINVRNNPMVAVAIGTEDMDNDKLAENALTVITSIKNKLPDKAFIKRIYIKTTMGPPIRVI